VAGVAATAEADDGGVAHLPTLTGADNLQRLRDSDSLIMLATPRVPHENAPAIEDVLDLTCAWAATFTLNDTLPPEDNPEVLLLRSGSFVHLRRVSPWDNIPWACSCTAFCENLCCKHALAISIAEGAWKTPQKFSAEQLRRKCRRGRPPKPGNRYSAAEQAYADKCVVFVFFLFLCSLLCLPCCACRALV